MKNSRLSNRELDVMCVLWEADKPLIASEICKKNQNLNINTVQAAINSLLKKGMIEIADIVYSGTVLSRCYRPTVSTDDYFIDEFQKLFPSSKKFSLPNFVAALLDHQENQDVIMKEMEQLINEKKAKLNSKEK